MSIYEVDIALGVPTFSNSINVYKHFIYHTELKQI